MLLQGAAFQWKFHRAAHTQKRLDLFDDGYPEKIFAVATASPNRPIYLADAQGTPGYIQAYWYATLRGLPTSDLPAFPPTLQHLLALWLSQPKNDAGTARSYRRATFIIFSSLPKRHRNESRFQIFARASASRLNLQASRLASNSLCR